MEEDVEKDAEAISDWVFLLWKILVNMIIPI
jgi:hypothetical protein